MADTFRIKFNSSTKDIEVEGSETFVKKYFEILQNLLSESGRASEEPRRTGARKAAGAARGKVSKTSTILNLIKDSKGGINTTELEKKSGLSDRQIWAIIYKAEKNGIIRKVKRGVYKAV